MPHKRPDPSTALRPPTIASTCAFGSKFGVFPAGLTGLNCCQRRSKKNSEIADFSAQVPAQMIDFGVMGNEKG